MAKSECLSAAFQMVESGLIIITRAKLSGMVDKVWFGCLIRSHGVGSKIMALSAVTGRL